MKILIVSPRYYPETFAITNIAEKIAEKGHDVTVITGRPNYGAWKIYDNYKNVKKENINGVKIIRAKEFPRKKGAIGLFVNYISIYRQFKKTIKKLSERYDIVISHILSPIFAVDSVGEYCRKFNVPHFFYGLDIWPESIVAAGYMNKKNILFNIFKSNAIKIYNSCDLIAYASQCVEGYLKNELKINKPFVHIYQPCLTKLPKESLVCPHNYKQDSIITILFCGTVAKFNHLDLMLKGISLSKHKERVRFVIVGSGSDLDRMKQISIKLHLEQNIKFIGRVPSNKTIDYYCNADVLFVPLYNNSYTSKMIPQKLLEYFMYNRPILGMIQGDGKKLLEDASKLNVLCEQTPEDLARGIDCLFDYETKDLITCGNDNRKFYTSKPQFSLDHIAEQIIDYSKKLILMKK